MVKLNTLPNDPIHKKNASKTLTLSELKAIQKEKKDCSKRVEELKYKLFQVTEKHMDQAIIILNNWAKN